MMVALIFLLFVFVIEQSYQINNGLGRTPQMGKMRVISSTRAVLDKTFQNVIDIPRIHSKLFLKNIDTLLISHKYQTILL